jgi:hypothetical protein
MIVLICHSRFEKQPPIAALTQGGFRYASANFTIVSLWSRKLWIMVHYGCQGGEPENYVNARHPSGHGMEASSVVLSRSGSTAARFHELKK